METNEQGFPREYGAYSETFLRGMETFHFHLSAPLGASQKPSLEGWKQSSGLRNTRTDLRSETFLRGMET